MRKSIIRLICSMLMICFLSAEQVQFSTIQKTARENAKAYWGDVDNEPPITYYGLNDKVCAYMYNFRKNDEFPSSNLESLVKNGNYDQADFGYILVNARLKDEPIEVYGNGIFDGRFAIIVWTDKIVSTSYELNIDIEEVTGSQEKANIAKKFYLKQNYPNPFNQSTVFEYGLARSSNVLISIYDSNGNLVETITNEYKTVGNHKIKWSAQNIPTGLYFYPELCITLKNIVANRILIEVLGPLF